MLIAARNAILAGGGLSAKDYVQNGLVAMWDGIENAGWGVHDAAATVWKDLIGTRDAQVVNGGGFDSNSFTNSSTKNTPASFTSAISAVDSRYIEIVMSSKRNSSGRIGIIVAGGTLMSASDKVDSAHEGFYGANLLDTYSVIVFGNSYHYNIPVEEAMSVAYSYTAKTAYRNGSVMAPLSISGYNTYSYGSRNRVPSIGGFAPNSTGNNIFTGHIYRIAYYSRALTAAEVAANYAVDKARFNLA